MKIIVPRIPKQTTKNELRKVATAVLQKKFRLPFTPRSEITACEILRITDSKGLTDYHGLLTLSSDAAGAWLIKRLKSESLHKKRLLAREFLDRDEVRDSFPDQHNRRRNNLDVNKVQEQKIMVEALDQFKKEYRA